MAGSWNHITTDDGKFRSGTFTQLIENLGDAHEAAGECFGMVWFLASKVNDLLGAGLERDRAQILDVIAQAEANCKAGLALGGTEEE